MKKRILLVSIGGLGNGGVQAIMMGIVRNLSKEYYFDILLFTSEERFYDKEFLSYGGNIFRIPHSKAKNKLLKKIDFLIRDFYVYREFKKILGSQKPYDVIHCNKQYESAPLLRAAAKYSIPIRICHSHIIEQSRKWPLSVINNKRIKQIEKYATHLIGCSEEACLNFYTKSSNWFVVPNFYDNKKYFFEPKGKSNDRIVLTQVGALSENKNQIFSVLVLKHLIDMGVDAILNLVGFQLQKGYKEKIAAIVKSLKMEESVFFYPGDIYIPEVLASTHAFVMPSIQEGFGIVLIEAQAFGLKCYASSSIPSSTNCGGVTYLDINSSESSMIWASQIFKDSKGGRLARKLYDTNKYKLSTVLAEYMKLYNKESI